jgi:hypothetical protein
MFDSKFDPRNPRIFEIKYGEFRPGFFAPKRREEKRYYIEDPTLDQIQKFLCEKESKKHFVSSPYANYVVDNKTGYELS